MLIGNKSQFAIESRIAFAYESKHFKALGTFVIYVGGFRYGVYEPDATMLACARDEARKTIINRGAHTAPFGSEADAAKIGDAIRDAIYAPNQEQKVFFGMPHADFCKLIYDKHLMWDPGDEAFDDSSYVFQFDLNRSVRLIAFKASQEKGNYHHVPETLRDICIEADTYYGVLDEWVNAFEREWAGFPKTPEND